MTRYDIIKMAREACIDVSENNSFADDMYISTLYRFAKLVAAAEREMCIANVFSYGGIQVYDASKIVETIRARGNT
jgi:hypothetical protein